MRTSGSTPRSGPRSSGSRPNSSDSRPNPIPSWPGSTETPDMAVDLDLACPGCNGRVDEPDYREHLRRCVAVQARPLVLAAARVAGSPSFHLDTFLEVVWLAFDLAECPAEAWAIDVLGKLPYVSRFDHGFYRYEVPPIG